MESVVTSIIWSVKIVKDPLLASIFELEPRFELEFEALFLDLVF